MSKQQDFDKVLRSPSQKIMYLIHFLKAKYKRREAERVRFLSQFIDPGSIVLDVGANFGYFTKEFAKIHKGSCTIHAFEPVTYSYNILQNVVGSKKNVQLHKVGLFNTEADQVINIPIKKSGKIGPGLSHLGGESHRDYIRENIHVVRLDDFVREKKLSGISFVKVDVEGAELQVFCGGMNTFKTLKPSVYSEIDHRFTARMGYEPKAIFDLFFSLGYASFYYDGQNLNEVSNYERLGNYLFRHFEAID